jgi:hypothetical protein
MHDSSYRHVFRPLYFMFWLHSLASVFTGLEISRLLPVTVSQFWTICCSLSFWTLCCSLPTHPKIDNPHYACGSWSLTDNIDARSRNHYCRGKTIIITYPECVFVALVTQHAQRVRHIILSSVSCPAVLLFPHSHKWHNFRKSYWTYNVRFDFLYNCIWNISHSKKNFVWYHKFTNDFMWSTPATPFCQILINLEFSPQIF